LDKGGLQLIPGTRRTVAIKRPGENKLLIIGFMISLLLCGAAAGMSMYKKSLETKLTDTLNSIQQLETQRDKTAEKKIKTLASQIKVIKDALLSHSYWTQGFTRIENAAKNEVRIVSMNVNTVEGKMSLEAMAPSYTLVARQIAALIADDGFTDIQLTKAGVETSNQIKFVLAIKFDPNKLIKKQ
jgi:hypothetical protein